MVSLIFYLYNGNKQQLLESGNLDYIYETNFFRENFKLSWCNIHIKTSLERIKSPTFCNNINIKWEHQPSDTYTCTTCYNPLLYSALATICLTSSKLHLLILDAFIC